MTATFARLVSLILLGSVFTSCVQAEELVGNNQPPPAPRSTHLEAVPALVEQNTTIELTSEIDLFCGVLEQWDGTEWNVVGGLANPDSGGESVFYEYQPESFACIDEGTRMAPTQFEMTGWEQGWYRLCEALGNRCSNTIELR